MGDFRPESHWIASYEVTNISCHSQSTPAPLLTINANFSSSLLYVDDPDRLSLELLSGTVDDDVISFYESTSATIAAAAAADDQFKSFEEQVRGAIRSVLRSVEVELRDFLQKEMGLLAWQTVTSRIGEGPISGTHVVDIDVTVAAELRGGSGAFGNESCSICLEKLACRGGFLEVLPCTHPFHPNCIGTWLTRSRDCPICRQAVPWI